MKVDLLQEVAEREGLCEQPERVEQQLVRSESDSISEHRRPTEQIETDQNRVHNERDDGAVRVRDGRRVFCSSASSAESAETERVRECALKVQQTGEK